MKNGKFLAYILIVVIALVTSIPSAWAGSPQRYRWEGVAIGVGAAILGSVLLDSIYRHHHAYGPPPIVVQDQYYQAPAEPMGHWETRRQWVAPVVKNVWNPGHYNHHGHWVKGHWISRELRSGYWVDNRIWVPHY